MQQFHFIIIKITTWLKEQLQILKVSFYLLISLKVIIRIEISFIGYKDTSIVINKTTNNINNNINTIYLKQDAKLLSEINIEDRKLIYETKIDKIVYNAENDLNETENNATDVLRKTPLVSVDLEDNISLRGSRNIKFLVNGKASSFFSSDVNTALQMIPADEIKSIEVITSPGAKFDGDGDAGIINIVNKKEKNRWL